MGQKIAISRITIDIPSVDHKRLKTMAALFGVTMRELILEAIEDRLRDMVDFNEQTMSAIAKVEKGKDLVEAKDLKDLFKKLGI